MIFYTLLLCSILVLLFVNKRNRRIGYILSSILLLFVAAFRFDVGWDYPSYFTTIDERIIAGLVHYEPFSLGIALMAIWCDETFLFFIVSSLIIYSLAFYALYKNSIDPPLSLIIYLGLFFLISLSIVRQAVAVSIVLCAYRYVLKKDVYKFSLLVIIATLFHYTAFISILIYWIYHHLSLWRIVIISFVVLVFKNVVISILASYGLYTEYLYRLNELGGGGLTKFFYLLLCFSFFLIIKRKGYSSLEKKHLSIIFVGLICPYVFGASMGERIGYYFLIYFCYIIPLLLRGKRKIKKVIYVMVFSLYFLLTVFYTSNIPGQKSAYTPYRTIFNTSEIGFRE